MRKKRITQEEEQMILNLVRYDPGTGRFFRMAKGRGPGAKQVGSEIVGTPNAKGYLCAPLIGRGKSFLLHRVAWFLTYGVWPEKEIDHIDHDTKNNRLDNLREADRAINTKNLSMNRRNTSGLTGVSWYKSRGVWRVQVVVEKRMVFSGYYPDLFSAAAARLSASIKFGFHKNHGLPKRENRCAAQS